LDNLKILFNNIILRVEYLLNKI